MLIGVMCALFLACSHEARLHVGAIDDRANMPVLNSDSVTTLISDSGITRYRIKAASWQIYDKATPAHWLFPKGVYLEKFDINLVVDASLQADSAIYFEDSERWVLTGNVRAMNEAGEVFETPRMVWEQREERILSDTTIVITRASSVIRGVGFESNQTMTQYSILQPTGYFPIED